MISMMIGVLHLSNDLNDLNDLGNDQNNDQCVAFGQLVELFGQLF